MRSLLVVEPDVTSGGRADLPPPISLPKKQTPIYVLEDYGYAVLRARDPLKAEALLREADALVLHMPLDHVRSVGLRLLRKKAMPLFWWCSPASAADSAQFCEDDAPVDGLLTSTMSEQELHWGLHFGERQFMERRQWQSEKRQLESRLEERKWIDMAKGILCKIKNISEAEAYEFLRKEAMNERKRMVDVATSIVKVHQILQDQK